MMRVQQDDWYLCSAEMSEATFTSLAFSIVQPHVEYAMEAKSLNLITGIAHLGSPPHATYEEKLRQLNLFSVGPPSWPHSIYSQVKIDLSPAFFVLGLKEQSFSLKPRLKANTNFYCRSF